MRRLETKDGNVYVGIGNEVEPGKSWLSAQAGLLTIEDAKPLLKDALDRLGAERGLRVIGDVRYSFLGETDGLEHFEAEADFVKL